jgi:hypothetical protein
VTLTLPPFSTQVQSQDAPQPSSGTYNPDGTIAVLQKGSDELHFEHSGGKLIRVVNITAGWTKNITYWPDGKWKQTAIS